MKTHPTLATLAPRALKEVVARWSTAHSRRATKVRRLQQKIRAFRTQRTALIDKVYRREQKNKQMCVTEASLTKVYTSLAKVCDWIDIQSAASHTPPRTRMQEETPEHQEEEEGGGGRGEMERAIGLY